MTTTLGFALLGLLAREPLSGYDLAQRLRGRIGFFWQARHSQIYPELARLEAAGAVAHAVVAQQQRPDKKVYSITETGRTVLRAWVTAPVVPSPPRDELVLKAYSLWLAEPEPAIALFREHERTHAARLADYEDLRDSLAETFGNEWRHPRSAGFAVRCALERGIGYEREYATWCGWVADELAATIDATAPGSGSDDDRPVAAVTVT